MSAYNPKVVDHFMNPRNVGEITDADGMGTVGHPSCGDIVRIYIKVEGSKENPTIKQARFKTFGCTTAIATSSIATELVQGKSVTQALQIRNRDVAEALGGLPPIKMHCSVLAEDAIKSAIADYYRRTGRIDEANRVLNQNQAHEESELHIRAKV
jgi:nitrogen fixation protein NifU and related proteins